jgi:hypothetical protein
MQMWFYILVFSKERGPLLTHSKKLYLILHQHISSFIGLDQKFMANHSVSTMEFSEIFTSCGPESQFNNKQQLAIHQSIILYLILNKSKQILNLKHTLLFRLKLLNYSNTFGMIHIKAFNIMIQSGITNLLKAHFHQSGVDNTILVLRKFSEKFFCIFT